MISKCIPLLLVLSSAYAQTVYLRYGGYDSRVTISGATDATPVVVTTLTAHGFEAGDLINIHYVGGNTAANGIRKVKAVISPTQFSITDLNDVDVAGNGDYRAGGWAGKVQATTIVGHPRAIGDGPDGVITARIKDPDGSGPEVAPAATGDYWTALQQHCDAYTPDPAGMMTYGGVQAGRTVELCALGWYMDNSKTQYLTAVKYWLNRVEQLASAATFSACDQSANLCGAYSSGSGVNWATTESIRFAKAYSLVYGELTAEERNAFAGKMLNGTEEGCTDTLTKAAGTVSITNGSPVVVGSGTSFTTEYTAGAQIYIKRGLNHVIGWWFTVQSITDDTHLTLTSNAGGTYADTYAYYIAPWTSTSCGHFFYHGSDWVYSPTSTSPRGITTISGTVTEDQTAITVQSTAEFLDPVPFYAQISYGNNWEVVKVTNMNATTMTIERGQLFTAARAWNSGAYLLWGRNLTHGQQLNIRGADYFGDVTHNLTQTRRTANIMVGTILADDPRGRALLQREWNASYDQTYPDDKDYWTAFNQGGTYYTLRHIRDWAAIAVVSATNFSPAIDIAGGNWLKRYAYNPVYFSAPWNLAETVSVCDICASDYSLGYFSWLGPLAHLYGSSDEVKYAAYYLRYLHPDYNATSLAADQDLLIHLIPYTPTGQQTEDYRSRLNPWMFFFDTDYAPENSYGLMISKTSLSDANATQVVAAALDRVADHMPSATNQYVISKKTMLLAANQSGGFGSVSGANMVQVGTSNTISATANHTILAKSGNANYVYLSLDSTPIYVPTLGVTLALRDVLHVKGASQDYVIVYDHLKSAAENQKKSRLQYFHNRGAYDWSFDTDTGNVVFTKASTARLSTKILLPSDPVTRATVSNTYARTVELTEAGTDDEFLVVHRPSANTSDTMPAVSLLSPPGAPDAFVGIQIDGAEPWVVLLTRNKEAQNGVSFTSSHQGIGKVVIAGLTPGAYEVRRNGMPVATPSVTEGDGTLYFEAPAGVFTIARMGENPTFGFATLPSGVVGQSYSVTLTATGTMLPLHWFIPNGRLPEGLSLSEDGILSGVPEKRGRAVFDLHITDSSDPALTLQGTFSLTVEDTATGLWRPEVQPATSTKAVARYGSAGLAAGQTCTIETLNGGGVVETLTDTGGASWREAVVGETQPLAPATAYSLRVTCGAAIQTKEFTTASGQTPEPVHVNLSTKAAPALPVDRVTVNYGTTPAMGESVEVPCAGGCNGELTAPSDNILYTERVYRNASGQPLATGSRRAAATSPSK